MPAPDAALVRTQAAAAELHALTASFHAEAKRVLDGDERGSVPRLVRRAMEVVEAKGELLVESVRLRGFVEA